MQAVDGYYLFKIGKSLSPLDDINQHTLYERAWLHLFVAHSDLQTFIHQSVFSSTVRNSRESANTLVQLLKELSDKTGVAEGAGTPIGELDAYRLQNALRDFHSVVSAEFHITPLFLVTPKRGFDLATMVYHGNTLFPASLRTQAPEALEDLKHGARCLAFELITAAAFHFHRANEAVLRRYWEAKCPGRKHPGNRTISDYLRALGQSRKGAPRVKAALKDIKTLYRNPVLHPEYQLKDVDEAIALMNTIHTSIVHMLSDMPQPTPASSAGAAA